MIELDCHITTGRLLKGGWTIEKSNHHKFEGLNLAASESEEYCSQIHSLSVLQPVLTFNYYLSKPNVTTI